MMKKIAAEVTAVAMPAHASMMAAGPRADVDRLGSGLEVEARFNAYTLARYVRAKTVLRAIAEKGLQAAIELSRSAAPEGAVTRAVSSGPLADVARSGEWAG